MPVVPTVEPQVRTPSFERPDFRAADQSQASVNQSLQQFGDALAINLNRIEIERDTAAAHEALYSFSDRARQKYAEMRQRKGGDAIGAHDEYKQWYDDQIKSTISDLRRGLQQDIFRSKAMSRRDRDLQSLAGHESAEGIRYKASQAAAGVESAIKDAQLYADDTGRIDALIIDAHNLIDFSRPGLDNSAEKSDVDFKIRSAAISALMLSDPLKAKSVFETWAPMMGPQAAALRNEVDKEWLYKQAKINAPGRFDLQFDFVSNMNGVDGDVKRAVIGRIGTDEAEYESRERSARAEHKIETDENDFATWQQYYNGTLTTVGLDQLASERKISLQAYRAIQEKMRNSGAEINNAVVVGEIASALASGVDVNQMLKDALHAGHIKTETYISMVGKAANREYKDGMQYLARSMKPGLLDRYNPDVNRRWADAALRYNSLVARGSDPMEASQQVVESYMGGVARSINGLPAPKYLQGNDKMDIAALQNAQIQTAEAFKMGEMDISEYNYQMKTLEALMKLANQYGDATKASEDLEAQRKKAEKRR